jgi:uncharacterized protein (TIGR01777 family)
MSTIITGGSGWIGRQLLPALKGSVRIVSRSRHGAVSRLGNRAAAIIECDLGKEQIGRDELAGVETVINLMGESIADGRWSESRKQAIRKSRVAATRNLVASLLAGSDLPTLLVSASATGFYGDQGDRVLTETSPAGDGFLPSICSDWEKETQPLVEAGVRVINLRIGIVLGRGGGAVRKLLTPFRWGLGGRLGSGQQWMSWIHIKDLVDVIPFLMGQPTIRGPVNAVAPHPVRNAEFAKSLANSLSRPAFLPVPAAVLRLAMGEMACILLDSQRVEPAVLNSARFPFRFPTIDAAWQDILSGQAWWRIDGSAAAET